MKTTFIKLRIAAVLAACVFAGILKSQTEQLPAKKPAYGGGFGHFGFGVQNVNISSLNSFLKQDGYGQINPNQLSWDGGGGWVLHNFFIGGEGTGFLDSKTSNSNNNLSFSGGCGFFNFGYAISTGKRSVLFPMLGAGGGGYNIMITQKNNPSGDFKDQLNTPAGNTQLDAGGVIFQAQMSWQYFFCGKNKEGFFVGLKGGYRFSPNTWNMQLNNSTLSNSPGINMNGMFASIVLGGGSLVK